MLKIRLFRTGKKHKPSYRLVVAKHTSAIGGKFIEIVGNYDPFADKVVIDKEKITKWMDNGAKPTNRVAKILTKEGLKHKSIVIHKFAERKKSKDETVIAEKETQNNAESSQAAQEPIVEKKTQNNAATQEPKNEKTEEPVAEEKSQDTQEETKTTNN